MCCLIVCTLIYGEYQILEGFQVWRHYVPDCRGWRTSVWLIQTHAQTKALLSATMKSCCNHQRNNSPADFQRSPLISVHPSFIFPAASPPPCLSFLMFLSFRLPSTFIFFYPLCVLPATLTVSVLLHLRLGFQSSTLGDISSVVSEWKKKSTSLSLFLLHSVSPTCHMSKS